MLVFIMNTIVKLPSSVAVVNQVQGCYEEKLEVSKCEYIGLQAADQRTVEEP